MKNENAVKVIKTILYHENNLEVSKSQEVDKLLSEPEAKPSHDDNILEVNSLTCGLRRGSIVSTFVCDYYGGIK